MHHGGARRERAIIGRDIMRDVGEEQADAAALAESELLEPARDARGTARNLGIAELASHEVEHRCVALSRHAGGKHVGERQRRESLIPCRRMVIIGRPGKAAVHRGLSSSRKARSEEHTSELQSLMRISYAVFCLKK